MREFPQARLVVHPRGARHMAEPAKLVAGVTAVYGEEYVARVYGDILPIPAERIIEAGEGTRISLGSRELLCLDTPGHARHHICIVDQTAGAIFTGDTFGLSYRELDVDGRQFIFPTTSPSQFEPQEMRRSIERLLSFKPSAMYLTHYGQVPEVERQAAELLRHLDFSVSLARTHQQAGSERHQRIHRDLCAYLLAEVRQHGCTLPDAEVLELWATDLELNAQGLGVWLDQQAA